MEKVLNNSFLEITNNESLEITGGGTAGDFAIDLGLIIIGGPVGAAAVGIRHVVQDLRNCYYDGYYEVMAANR